MYTAYEDLKKQRDRMVSILILFVLVCFLTISNLIWLANDNRPPSWDQSTHLRLSIEYFDIFHKWRSRNILRMEKCQHCDVALVCGGGCPLENLAEGKDIFEPACIPVREEMQIGVNVLYPHLVQLADQPVMQEPCCGPQISVEESCCSQEEPGGDSVEKKKEQPRCNCGEVKIIPLDEEE